jgi:hypothetical protein
MGVVEYEQGSRFPGTIGRTVEEPSTAWPAQQRAPDGAPNVLFVVLDDVGYGQLSCFGGLVETPNIDRIAAMGLRYANMHTTALCSPTRSCILTGRNHHSNDGAIVPPFATPPVFNRPYSIEAELEVPDHGAEGVLLAQGGDAGGYTFFVADSRPHFSYNYVGRERFDVACPDALSPGEHAVRFEFVPTGKPDIRNGIGVPGGVSSASMAS